MTLCLGPAAAIEHQRQDHSSRCLTRGLGARLLGLGKRESETTRRSLYSRINALSRFTPDEDEGRNELTKRLQMVTRRSTLLCVLNRAMTHMG